MGVFLVFNGDCEQAIDWFDKVLALHSETPHTVDIMLMWKSLSQFSLTRYDEAITTLKGINSLDYIKSLLLAACYAQSGRIEDAGAMSNEVLRRRPNLRVSDIGLWQYFRVEKDQDRLRSALIQAGLPG
jgi:tetratricopeptide (TPR) repeat protein